MTKILLKCENCKLYTFSLDIENSGPGKCPQCGGQLKTPHPAKFSMDNKYNKYLREIKKGNQV